MFVCASLTAHKGPEKNNKTVSPLNFTWYDKYLNRRNYKTDREEE